MLYTATYKGWKIEVDEDDHGDCRKLMHYAVKDGVSMGLDLNPYFGGNVDICAAMIDLDFPRREKIGSIGPLDDDDVRRLWREKFGDTPMPKADYDQGQE